VATVERQSRIAPLRGALEEAVSEAGSVDQFKASSGADRRARSRCPCG
jgi:hypothetical protein